MRTLAKGADYTSLYKLSFLAQMVHCDSPVITGYLFLPTLQILRKIPFQELPWICSKPFLKQTNKQTSLVTEPIHYMAVSEYRISKGGECGYQFYR